MAAGTDVGDDDAMPSSINLSGHDYFVADRDFDEQIFEVSALFSVLDEPPDDIAVPPKIRPRPPMGFTSQGQ